VNRRVAVASAVALACTFAIAAGAHRRALADDASAPTIAAVVAPADDVRKAVLVGPSGQVWEPDGAGTWTRRTGGGVAADVRGATLAGVNLVVAGKATPFYRRADDRWNAMRLGERGRTQIGRGPRASVSIGRLVFVWTGTSWKRIGAAPGTVTALWSAGETKVVLATDAGLFRLMGGAFRPVPLPAGTAAISALDGAAGTWAVTADGAAIDTTTRRVHRPTVGGQPMTVALVTTAGDSAWALGTTAAGPALARQRKGAWSDAPAPPLSPDDPPIALAADTAGAVLVVTRGGVIHLAGTDGTWINGSRTQSLPVVTSGPGPARAR
jgi:hypothetical protein